MYKLIRVVSVMVALSGLSLVIMYVYWAVIQRWNDADQSLLFWYLPILLFGIILLGAGLRLKHWTQRRLKQQRRPEKPG